MDDIKRPEKKTRRSLNESVDNELKAERIAKAKSTAKKILEHKIKTSSGRIDERAEMSAKGIDQIELHELLSSMKENVEYDINDDLEYFRVVLGLENGKAYIDIESKDSDEWNIDGYSVDDILEPTAKEWMVIDGKDVDKLKDEILAEKKKVESEIIPKLAKEWGFKNMKSKTNESVKHLKIRESDEEDTTACLDDMLAGNLFREYQHGILKGLPETKFYDDLGNIVVRHNYDGETQADYDVGDDATTIFISLIDKGDEALAKYVAEKFGLEHGWTDYHRRQPGYNYVYKIVVPHSKYYMPIGDFLVDIGANPEDFNGTPRIARLMRNAQKRLDKKQA